VRGHLPRCEARIVHQYIVLVLVQPCIGNGNQHRALRVGAALCQFEFALDISHAHDFGIDDQIFDGADTLTVHRAEIPSTNIRFAFGDLQIICIFEMHQPRARHVAITHGLLLFV